MRNPTVNRARGRWVRGAVDGVLCRRTGNWRPRWVLNLGLVEALLVGWSLPLKVVQHRDDRQEGHHHEPHTQKDGNVLASGTQSLPWANGGRAQRERRRRPGARPAACNRGMKQSGKVGPSHEACKGLDRLGEAERLREEPSRAMPQRLGRRCHARTHHGLNDSRHGASLPVITQRGSRG
jgi:hypothetical protein